MPAFEVYYYHIIIVPQNPPHCNILYSALIQSEMSYKLKIMKILQNLRLNIGRLIQVNSDLQKWQAFVAMELVVLFIVGVLFFTQQNLIFPKSTVAFEHNLTPITNGLPSVMGAQTEITSTIPSPTLIPTIPPTLTISPTDIPTPTITPKPAQTIKSAKKNSYSIAIYGDSMIDTMGERCEYLEHSLKRLYPNVNFTLYNYGKGSENVEMGLNRWNNRLDYQDRHFPSITELKPDIIILGSFAYNPFSPYNRDRHWVGLTKLIETARSITPSVYQLAEIVPLRKNFGKGPNGVNWEESTAYEHSGHIVEQLENAVSLSRNLNVPLIDVFHSSIGVGGLNNAGDGIHASVAGHEFTADIIAKTINLN